MKTERILAYTVTFIGLAETGHWILYGSDHCYPTNFHANTKAFCGLRGSGAGGLSSISSSSDLRSNRLS